jgi:hypothetical protein
MQKKELRVHAKKWLIFLWSFQNYALSVDFSYWHQYDIKLFVIFYTTKSREIQYAEFDNSKVTLNTAKNCCDLKMGINVILIIFHFCSSVTWFPDVNLPWHWQVTLVVGTLGSDTYWKQQVVSSLDQDTKISKYKFSVSLIYFR